MKRSALVPLATALTVACTAVAPLTVSANGATPPTLTEVTGSATIADTAAWDSFTDINGTISGIIATEMDSALIGGIAAVQPPDTEVFTYTKMKVGAYGTMFIGESSDPADVFAYVVNNNAINSLGDGASDTDDFIFDADGDPSTTADQTTYSISLSGANDKPSLGTSIADFTSGVSADDVSYTVGSHPPSETPIKAFDDSTSTKYLNFAEGGSDLLVDVGGLYVLTAVGLTTANDEPDRDPTKLRLFGSATSFDDLVEIGSELSVTPPAGRQEDYTDVAVNNTTAYQYYRIVFSEISDAAATNSMQVAEIRLSGYTDAGFPRFTPGEPATGFTSAVTIYDENTQTITATISANLEDGDILGCPDCAANNITATWTSPNLVLTANGSPTQANWQTAIQSLTFLRAVGGSTSAPSITLTVSDGTLEGSAVLDIPIIERTLTVTAPSSTLTNGASLELSSSVSHGSGAVTYSTTGPCSVDGTTVTATGPTGQCVITALIAADSGYSEVTSPDLALTILSIQPDISMSDPTIFGAVDQPIGDIAPANTGDDATWSVTPALPVGLVLDTATGVISGTPTNASAATTYTLTATNSGGSDTVSFDLSIVNAPDAPTDLAATAGNASATISFTAGGNGGSDIVNYQFSIDDGTTWTALDPADSESPITITGLTNGTEQTIVLRAVSEAGTGATSDPVTVTPTAPTTTTAQPTTTTAQPTTTTSILPVRDNAGTLPQVNASTAGIIINADGEAIVATPTLEGDSVVLSDGDTVFRLAGTLSDGNAATAQSNGRLVIDSGGSVRTSGAGFSPGSTVHVWVMSDPIYLGPVTVNADGTFDATLQLPSELPAGDHTIQANGTLADDSTRSMNLGISVLPLGELPATGANPNVAVIVLALALGVFLTISARRRSI